MRRVGGRGVGGCTEGAGWGGRGGGPERRWSCEAGDSTHTVSPLCLHCHMTSHSPWGGSAWRSLG